MAQFNSAGKIFYLILIFAFIYVAIAASTTDNGVPKISATGWTVSVKPGTKNAELGDLITLQIAPKSSTHRAQFKSTKFSQIIRWNFIDVALFAEWNSGIARAPEFIRNLTALATSDGDFVVELTPEPSAAIYRFEVTIKGSGASARDLVAKHVAKQPVALDTLREEWGIWKTLPVLSWPYPCPPDFVLLKQDDTILRPGARVKLTGKDTTTLILRPLPLAKAQYPQDYKHFVFNVRLISDNVVKGPEWIDYVYNEEQDGYTFGIKPVENGDYELQVYINYIHSFSDPLQGPFAMHVRNSEGNLIVTNVPVEPIVIEVTDGEDLPILGENPNNLERCTEGELAGRWINLPLEKECEVPVCSGTRRGVVNIPNSDVQFVLAVDGHHSPWVWVPYSCYYHLFNAQDILHCAKENDWHWIQVIGDSTVREVATNLMMTFRQIDGHKFEHVSNMLNEKMKSKYPFRVGYEFLSPVYDLDVGGSRNFTLDRLVLDRFNLVGNTSLPYEWREEMFPAEKTRPDVLVFTTAMVYAIWKQSYADHEAYIDELVEYLRPWSEEPDVSPETGKQKMTIVWYNGPYLHAPPHDYKYEITATRHIKFHDYAVRQLRDLGVVIIDVMSPTQTRAEYAWDGTHYTRGSNGLVVSPVSHMMTQIVHNTIFKQCSGTGERVLEHAKE